MAIIAGDHAGTVTWGTSPSTTSSITSGNHCNSSSWVTGDHLGCDVLTYLTTDDGIFITTDDGFLILLP